MDTNCPYCGKEDVTIKRGHNNIVFILCGAKDDDSDGCGAITSFRGDAATSAVKTMERYKRRTP